MKILSNAALDCELKQRKGRLTSHQYECFKFAVQHHWTVSLHQFCVLACALFATVGLKLTNTTGNGLEETLRENHLAPFNALLAFFVLERVLAMTSFSHL